jgi:hypothetical protein
MGAATRCSERKASLDGGRHKAAPRFETLGAAQWDGTITRHTVRFSFVDVFPMKPRSYCRLRQRGAGSEGLQIVKFHFS